MQRQSVAIARESSISRAEATMVAIHAGAEGGGGRAGAWPPYDPKIYTRNLNFG